MNLLDWFAGRLSADAAIYGNITILRDRARQLADNSPIVVGFLDELANNVVGPEGITLQPRVVNGSGDPVKKTNWAITSAWNEWSMPESASIDAIDSWVDIQRQHVQAIARDGESIIRRHNGADNEFGFALQLIDPDLLDETYNVPPNDAGVEIRMSVEVNKFGKPLAYWLFKNHPADIYRRGASRERVRVPAEDIIHDFVRKRPGQTRGVTWFAPILTTVRMIDAYLEADLVAARVQASQMGFITNNNEEVIAAYAGDLARRKAQNATKAAQPKTMEMVPGITHELMPGQGVEWPNPTHPSMAAESFTRVMLRIAARGLGTSYHTLTGDLTQANYSSLRAGLLPERDHWRALQVWLSNRCHRRVFKWWLPFAHASQKLVVDRRIPAGEVYPHKWKGRGWKWVDPLKDLQAAEVELRLALTSRQKLHGEAGTNFEDTVDDLAYEDKYAGEQDVDISPERKAIAAKPEPNDDDNAPTQREKPEARRLSVIGGT